MELRRWYPGFLNRSRDLIWNRIVNHVSNTGDQPEGTVWNFFVKLNCLAVLHDMILRACHDNDWHRQFLIAMPHGSGDRMVATRLGSPREFARVVWTSRWRTSS